MAIYRLLKETASSDHNVAENAAFDDQAVKSMTAAYEDILGVLRLADREDPVTKLIAERIIQHARSGERDPARLREFVLKEFGVPSG